MSDAPFWRPDAPPEGHRSAQTPSPGFRVDLVPIHDTLQRYRASPPPTPGAGEPGPVSSSRSHPARWRFGVVVGMAGLLVGLTAGALFVPKFDGEPVAITLDTFPSDVFGRQRDDLPWRDTRSEVVDERLNALFQEQLAAHRFAYGGDGAEFSYGEKYWLTVVNGRLPTTLPMSDEEDMGPRWVPVSETGSTRCVAEIPFEEESDPGLSDVLNDDSQDVFDYLESPPRRTLTECVFYDDGRNLALRLRASVRLEDLARTVEEFQQELDRLHAELTG